MAPRAGADGGGGGVEASVIGGGVCRGDAGRATLLRVRGERRGVLMGSGLWRRCGLDRRGDGLGDPCNKDCNARQVPRRPLPDEYPLSEGGGVEKRRLGVKRDDRRTSQGIADGSSIVAEVYIFDWRKEIELSECIEKYIGKWV